VVTAVDRATIEVGDGELFTLLGPSGCGKTTLLRLVAGFSTPDGGASNPKAARAFIEFLLSERGQRVFMERGLLPITPKYKVQGPPGSPAEMAVELTGGVRSYFDRDVANVYDEAVAQKRSDALKQKFRTDIEATWKKP